MSRYSRPIIAGIISNIRSIILKTSFIYKEGLIEFLYSSWVLRVKSTFSLN
jgi:hypothetical protein